VTYVRESYAVWELTLQCNLRCGHCGSRAGSARNDELDTDEALDLVRQLAELGIREVTIEGGEAFLRRDWLEIARAIVDHGMRATLVTGGYGISRETARRMKEVGFSAISVSVDGLEATHDRIRGREGSFRAALQSCAYFRDAGLYFGTNTQINRLSAPELPELYETLRDVGARAWQFQLTQALGNGADWAPYLLQPAELVDLYPVLARIMRRARAEGLQPQPGNNIGYFGPYEDLFRAGATRWMGCQAGLAALGIHANGEIKACPTLPSAFVGGSIREAPLSEIVDRPIVAYNLDAGTERATEGLYGFCKGCEHAPICRAGCTVSQHTMFGKRGDNPFCHHRALTLAERGVRERVVPKLLALGKPFDCGTWSLVEEPADAPWPGGDPHHFTRDRVRWPAGWEAWGWIEAAG
jgi:radical SAM protein with 4Fe4S-binding SPASM domain